MEPVPAYLTGLHKSARSNKPVTVGAGLPPSQPPTRPLLGANRHAPTQAEIRPVRVTQEAFFV